MDTLSKLTFLTVIAATVILAVGGIPRVYQAGQAAGYDKGRADVYASMFDEQVKRMEAE